MRYIFCETSREKFIPTTFLNNTNHFNKVKTELGNYLDKYNTAIGENTLEDGDSVLVIDPFYNKYIYTFHLV